MASVAEQVIKQLQELGWSSEHATGIAANLQAESNFDHQAVGDSGKAYGIAQWHPNRQADFKEFSGKDIRESSLEEQVAFIDHELRAGKEQSAGRKLAATTDAGEAAAVVSKFYERPRDTAGAAAARTNIANQLTGKPAMATTSTSDLATEGQASIARNDAAATALKNLFTQQISAINGVRDIEKGTLDDVGLIKTTEELAAASAQKATFDFATRAGAVPGLANEVLAGLIQQSNTLGEKQREVAARIENANDPRTMLDRPVRWLADYLLLPFNERKLKAVDAQVKSTRDQISAVNNSVQNYKATQDAIAQSKTAATAQAAARVAQAGIESKVAALEIDALRTNAEGIKTVNSLRNNTFDILRSVRSAETQDAQIDAQREASKLHSQSLELALGEKQTRQKAENSILARINAGSEYTGTLKFKSYDEFTNYLKFNPAYAPTAAINYQAGFAIETGGVPTIASTPVDALEFNAIAHPNLSAGQTLLMGKLNDELSDIRRSNTRSQAITGPNGKPSKERTNLELGKSAETYAKDVTKGENNFYAPMPVAQLVKDPEFAKTYLGSKIMEPLGDVDVKTGYTTSVNLLLDAVKRGEISRDQADSELGFMAAKLMGYNNELYRYKATAGVPSMTTLKIPVDVPQLPQLLGRGATPGMAIAGSLLEAVATAGYSLMPTERTPVDLANPVARSTLLNRIQASALKAPVTTNKMED